MRTKAALTDAVTERERENRRLAYEAAVQGIMLLKHDGTLPIIPCRLALFGAGAGYTIKGGTGSGEVNVRHAVNILEGLENAGFTIATRDWTDRYDNAWKIGKAAFIEEHRVKLHQIRPHILADMMAAEYRYPSGDRICERDIVLSDTDVCIYVLSRQSGEGHDRRDEAGSFRLDPIEEYNIRLCAERYRRFILCINTGAPIDLTPLDGIPGVNAIIYMGQPGMEGGNALAAILTGEETPSGKLAVTWPKSYEDVPFGDEFGTYANNQSHALYKEGIYVGYRYFDSFSVEPRYPFGFGLSYTDFELMTEKVEINETQANISVNVKNTGSYAGREIVQAYVSCSQNGLDKEYQRLTAFAKTGLIQAGETQRLRLSFPLSSLSCYDEANAETCLEQGEYILRVGDSSRNTKPIAKMILHKSVILNRHRNLCKSEHTITELKKNCTSEYHEDLSTIQMVEIDPDKFDTVSFDYSATSESFPTQVQRNLDTFTQKDLAKFCAGTGLFGEQSGFRVPGAVGHTTTEYNTRGIPNVELCDGPAGLRVQRRSTINKKGRIKAVDASISLYEFLPKSLTKRILGDPEKEQLLYQYVTGFPIAAVIAQSWSTELAYKIGRAVSSEMQEFGVTYWLAPALNIVRNPLCGRNYEYYSEDPLISGKMAAAVTKGVQNTSGCYVTIKHFAVNNQEENRYYVSSDIDERAMREIYLRGFEIAVRESKPKSLMAAYNKINGTYCANNRELCTDILRSEWDYDGIVMTDWLSTGEDRADEQPLALAVFSTSASSLAPKPLPRYSLSTHSVSI